MRLRTLQSLCDNNEKGYEADLIRVQQASQITLRQEAMKDPNRAISDATLLTRIFYAERRQHQGK